MTRMPGWMRDAALIVTAIVAGWWMHGSTVQAAGQSSAASLPALIPQLVGPGSVGPITVYRPEHREFFVYENTRRGDAHLTCSYKFRLSETGDTMDRENCGVGSLLR